MAGGRDIAFWPYPGLGVETTMERPTPKIRPSRLVEALEKVYHLSELFAITGKLWKSPNGQADDFRMDPFVQGQIPQKYLAKALP